MAEARGGIKGGRAIWLRAAETGAEMLHKPSTHPVVSPDTVRRERASIKMRLFTHLINKYRLSRGDSCEGETRGWQGAASLAYVSPLSAQELAAPLPLRASRSGC